MAKTVNQSKTDFKQKIRLLLNLWNIGGVNTDVKQSELTQQVKLSSEKAKDYQFIYTELAKEGLIEVKSQGRTIKVSLTPQGLLKLEQGLKSPDFHYRPQQRVKTKDFNALLNWIKAGAEITPNPVKSAESQGITTYEAFKTVALEVYDCLNRDYNLDHLVPIYRIRRTIGDRVSRSQFNDWMLEMQADDYFQFMSGEMLDITPDKVEDSITTELNGLRYYAQRIT